MDVLLFVLFSIIATNGDGGSCIDPNGGPCVRTLDNDGRSIIDPIGRASVQSDRAAGLDPDG